MHDLVIKTARGSIGIHCEQFFPCTQPTLKKLNGIISESYLKGEDPDAVRGKIFEYFNERIQFLEKKKEKYMNKYEVIPDPDHYDDAYIAKQNKAVDDTVEKINKEILKLKDNKKYLESV